MAKEKKKNTVKGFKTEKKFVKFRKWFYYLSKFAFSIVGLFYPTRIINKKNIKTKGNYIYACNHLTNIDIPFTQIRMKGLRRYVGKKEFVDTKAYSSLARFGVIFIDREMPDMNTINEIFSVLEQKNGQIFLFPEGTRNKGDHTKMLPLKHGISIFAGKTNTPVIPIILYRPCKMFKMNYIYIGEEILPPDCNGRMPRSKQLREMTAKYTYEMEKARVIVDDYVENKRWKRKNRLPEGAVAQRVIDWEAKKAEEMRVLTDEVKSEN